MQKGARSEMHSNDWATELIAREVGFILESPNCVNFKIRMRGVRL
jgi:hypothetical protein